MPDEVENPEGAEATRPPLRRTDWQDDVWRAWTRTGTMTWSTTNVPNTVTITGGTNSTGIGIQTDGWYSTAPPETEEQRRLRRERIHARQETERLLYEEQRRRQARIAEHRRLAVTRRSQAQERAMELVDRILTDEEREQWHKKKYVDIPKNDGEYFYRVTQEGVAGNVWICKTESNKLSICIHPNMYTGEKDENNCPIYLPDADAWVSQIIGIKTDEEHFILTGNAYPGRGHSWFYEIRDRLQLARNQRRREERAAEGEEVRQRMLAGAEQRIQAEQQAAQRLRAAVLNVQVA